MRTESNLHPFPTPAARLAALLAVLAGCASPRVPQVPPIPGVPTLDARRAPAPSHDEAKVELAPEPAAVDPAAVYDKGAIAEGSSVVISLPADPIPREAAHADDPSRVAAAGYGLLERELEKELLRKGFDVLDRSRFVAQLRQQMLAAKQDGGGEGAARVAADTSDLVLAAQGDGVKCDFVLQISGFQIREAAERRIDLKTQPAVVQFVGRNPGIKIPDSISQPLFVAECSAKLFRVASGSIDWVGSFAADSLAALDGGIEIRVGCLKTVDNAAPIDAAIEEYNHRLAGARARAEAARSALADAHAKDRTERIPQLQAALDSAVEELEALAEPPAATKAPWQYEYQVALTYVPDLRRPDSVEEQEIRHEHDVQLTRAVVSALCDTIRVGTR